MFINEVSVAAAFQNQGIGRQLVARLCELARSLEFLAEVWVATEQEHLSAPAATWRPGVRKIRSQS